MRWSRRKRPLWWWQSQANLLLRRQTHSSLGESVALRTFESPSLSKIQIQRDWKYLALTTNFLWSRKRALLSSRLQPAITQTQENSPKCQSNLPHSVEKWVSTTRLKKSCLNSNQSLAGKRLQQEVHERVVTWTLSTRCPSSRFNHSKPLVCGNCRCSEVLEWDKVHLMAKKVKKHWATAASRILIFATKRLGPTTQIRCSPS